MNAMQIVSLCFLHTLIITAKAAPATRPNILFIMVDDSEKVEYGCYGGDSLTPHIDTIAKDGIVFHNGFTSSSVCTPTRYTVMTGHYASRAPGLNKQPEYMSSFVRWNTYLEPGGHNIASVLRDNGYITGMVGKWHIGSSNEYRERIKKIHENQFKNTERIMKGETAQELTDPDFNRYLQARYEIATDDIKQHYGFDDVRSFYGGNLTDYPKAMRNFRYHNQDWITKGALEFIDEHAKGKKPFFLFFSSTLQHGPEPNSSIEADRRITPKGYIDEAPDVQPNAASIFQRLEDAGLPKERAPFVWLDDGIGAIIQKLKDKGIYENTLIFFFSDQQSWGKGSCFDAGVCTPYIMSWPARLPKGVDNNELVSNIDFAPTIFQAARVQPPKDMVIDGMSILPMVAGKMNQWRDEVFFELGDMRAVRTKDYKYIAIRSLDEDGWAALSAKDRKSEEYRKYYFQLSEEYRRSSESHLQHSRIAKWRECHARFASDPDQLYDLRIDPSECVNFYDNEEYAHIFKDMQQRLKEWLHTMPGPYGEFTK